MGVFAKLGDFKIPHPGSNEFSMNYTKIEATFKDPKKTSRATTGWFFAQWHKRTNGSKKSNKR